MHCVASRSSLLSLALSLLAGTGCGPGGRNVPPPEPGLTLADTASDHTAMYVSGGAGFGTLSQGQAPVTLTPIEVSSQGTAWNMDEIWVYAGSGTCYPPSTAGQQLVANVASPGVKLHTIPAGSFSSVPNYNSAHPSYWIWVVVKVVHDGDGTERLFNAQRCISQFTPSVPPVEFPEEYSEQP
jgi:hypothetical protein